MHIKNVAQLQKDIEKFIGSFTYKIAVQPKKVLQYTIKAVRFGWRHFFVLNLLHCLLIAFIEAPSVKWNVFATYLFIAIFLDWLKTKIKFSNSSSFDHYQAAVDSFRKHSEWVNNPSKEGSAAWNCKPFNTGSSAYYSRKMSQYN